MGRCTDIRQVQIQTRGMTTARIWQGSKNSEASRESVASSGKLDGGLTPTPSEPVGLPCTLLVVNWVVMIFVHLHIFEHSQRILSQYRQ